MADCLTSTPSTELSAEAGDGPEANVDSLVSSVLSRFGVACDHDVVLDTVDAALAQRGHHVQVVSLRHGELVLEAPASAARLLLWDLDPVRDELAAKTDGVVSSVKVRVAR